MSDLKERFSLADRIESPELWSEARRRAITPDAASRSASWQPDRGKRAAAALVAFAVFAGAAVFAWNLSHPELAPTPPPEPAVDLASELPIGWSELPAPPEVRSGAATAWTGSQLLVWGGYEYVGGNEDPRRDGLRVSTRDPAVVAAAPTSPLEGRSGTAFAWTGQELSDLGWAGTVEVRDAPFFSDGAAYDPLSADVADACRRRRSTREPRSPCGPAGDRSSGEARIRAARRLDGAAYDPIDDHLADDRRRADRTSPTAPLSGPATRCSWSAPRSMATTTPTHRPPSGPPTIRRPTRGASCRHRICLLRL